MTNTLQPGISKMAARALLASAVVLGLGVFTTELARAQTFTALYAFSNGTSPLAGLVRDAEGNLYGTTEFGGASGDGLVFKLSKDGTETVLHNFTGSPTDGAYPAGGLVLDAAGNLYGTTVNGGTSGDGVVFKLHKNGTETVLHDFTGGTMDGCDSYGGLLLDETGNLYGTTAECGASNHGTVFKLSPTRRETVLHSFDGLDGYFPIAGVIMDANGNLYGDTNAGGAHNFGTVYRLNKKGVLTVLHSFDDVTDGAYPPGGLIRDAAGNLYGTTTNGGPSGGDGVVFKLSKEGTETVLHKFTGSPADGAFPHAGVIMDAKGNLYGTTEGGGDNYCNGDHNGCGVVFKLNARGKITLLHNFTGYSDGAEPTGALLQAVNGDLYGTAFEGGDASCGPPWGCGTVWKITP